MPVIRVFTQGLLATDPSATVELCHFPDAEILDFHRENSDLRLDEAEDLSYSRL
jgi:hypothetical protein